MGLVGAGWYNDGVGVTVMETILSSDIALFWAVIAIGAVVAGLVIFLIKSDFLEDKTHLDKMKGGR